MANSRILNHGTTGTVGAFQHVRSWGRTRDAFVAFKRCSTTVSRVQLGFHVVNHVVLLAAVDLTTSGLGYL